MGFEMDPLRLKLSAKKPAFLIYIDRYQYKRHPQSFALVDLPPQSVSTRAHSSKKKL